MQTGVIANRPGKDSPSRHRRGSIGVSANRWGKIMSGEKKMLMRMFNVGTLAALLTACGESADEAYVRGYDEGYIDGQYEVCNDLERIAPGLKARLQDCDGFY